LGIQYYATIGTDTKINGFYNTDIHDVGSIPSGAIEITEEQWSLFIQVPHQLSNGNWVPVPPLTPEEVAEIERTRPRTETENLQAENADLKTRVSDVEMFVADMISATP
jgi:hypothetical protein